MTSTAQDMLTAVIDRLNTVPVHYPTAINLSANDAPKLNWDFSKVTHGAKVFYFTGRRKRERLGFFRELSECGRLVKVFKVSRHAWIKAEDVTGLGVSPTAQAEEDIFKA